MASSITTGSASPVIVRAPTSATAMASAAAMENPIVPATHDDSADAEICDQHEKTDGEHRHGHKAIVVRGEKPDDKDRREPGQDLPEDTGRAEPQERAKKPARQNSTVILFAHLTMVIAHATGKGPRGSLGCANAQALSRQSEQV